MTLQFIDKANHVAVRTKPIITTGLVFTKKNGLLHIYTYEEGKDTSQFVGLLKMEEMEQVLHYLNI